MKNKQHRLKKSIMCNSIDEGGIEKLDFSVLNQTFKVKWIKQCLDNDNSLWYFIPAHIFQKVGGSQFLFQCNYRIQNLPIKLLSWKMFQTQFLTTQSHYMEQRRHSEKQ